MADGKNSGLASGTNGSRQLTVENGELEQLVSANENKVDFYGGGSGKLLPAEYKQWIGVSQRDNLLSKAKNVVLRNAVNQLYRPGAFIGDGGTASFIKFEKRTGLYLGKNGGTHEKKGIEMIKYIEKKILTQNLSNSDRKLAKKLVRKLKQALGENKK